VQGEDRRRRRAGSGDPAEEGVDRGVVVAEVGDDRRDHDVAGKSGVGHGPDQVEPGSRRGRSRLETMVQFFVADGD